MSKDSDQRYTPRWLLDIVEEMMPNGHALDPATSLANPLNARMFCTEEGSFYASGERFGEADGLLESWGMLAQGSPVYLNPPYSAGNLPRWGHKCITEAAAGCEIQMLTMGDSSTKWFDRLCEECDVRCDLRRRVAFIQPDTGKPLSGSAKFPTTVWYWGPRRRLFRDVWELHGRIYTGWGPDA